MSKNVKSYIPFHSARYRYIFLLIAQNCKKQTCSSGEIISSSQQFLYGFTSFICFFMYFLYSIFKNYENSSTSAINRTISCAHFFSKIRHIESCFKIKTRMKNKNTCQIVSRDPAGIWSVSQTGLFGYSADSGISKSRSSSTTISSSVVNETSHGTGF